MLVADHLPAHLRGASPVERGPTSPDIERKTTHDLVRWTRDQWRDSTRRDAAMNPVVVRRRPAAHTTLLRHSTLRTIRGPQKNVL